jgi:ferredoxin
MLSNLVRTESPEIWASWVSGNTNHPMAQLFSHGVPRKEKELMPKLEVEDIGTFDVPEDKRLVLAIEEDAGVDIMHRCGSYAACTTCRNEYLEGEPEKMTSAEVWALESRISSGGFGSRARLCATMT